MLLECRILSPLGLVLNRGRGASSNVPLDLEISSTPNSEILLEPKGFCLTTKVRKSSEVKLPVTAMTFFGVGIIVAATSKESGEVTQKG